jgi:hypothetical protein
VLRSVGGTLGGQLTGSLLTGHVVAGTDNPAWSAFRTAIWIDIAVALIAVAGGFALRARRRPAPIGAAPQWERENPRTPV